MTIMRSFVQTSCFSNLKSSIRLISIQQKVSPSQQHHALVTITGLLSFELRLLDLQAGLVHLDRLRIKGTYQPVERCVVNKVIHNFI